MLETAHHECGNRAVDDIKRYRFIISLIMRSYYNYGCPEAWTRTELCPPPFENVKATYYIHFNFNILDCIQKTKIVATIHLSRAQTVSKCVCGQGSAPGPC